MPVPKKANGKAAAPKPIVYDQLEVNGIPIPREKLRLSLATIKRVLGLETEEEWAARTKREKKLAEDVKLTFADAKPAIEPLFVDRKGQKVVAWQNLNNRPFEIEVANKYAQDILTRDWAGYHNGVSVNGETMIVGEHGGCLSIQHRGAGLYLACQDWEMNPAKWKSLWPEEPFIESLLVTGVSENPKVIRSLDNVRPRSLGDTIYTSPVFSDIKTFADRKECSRYLDNAIDLLWKRTAANETAQKYQTHAASFQFADRHKRLQVAVREVFELNKGESGRGLSLMKLWGGHAATALYLMACSGSDLEAYRKAEPAPSERKLNFDRWDQAVEFWAKVAEIGKLDNEGPDYLKHPFRPLRQTLAKIIDANKGSIRVPEKMVLYAKAWSLFLAGKPLSEAGLELHYKHDRDTTSGWESQALLDTDCFGGIDLGQKPEPQDDIPQAEAEANGEAVKAGKRKALAQEAVETVRAPGEVAKPEPRPSDKEGKPPAPKMVKPVPAAK